MTFGDLIRETRELELRSQAFKSDVKGWLNRAHRQIAQRRDWSWMHERLSVTILANATSATISTRFKSLAREKSPISYTAPGQAFPAPVTILSRAELERMSPGGCGYIVNTSGYWSPYYVFLERNGATWTINVPPQFPYTTDATYAVSCYLFPADLDAGDDSTPLTQDAELAEAMINWVKWKALPKADPEGAAAKEAFEDAVRTACITDARQVLSGRSIHW